MPLIETESLVLKTYNLAEADRIVLLLTRDHGLVRGVAKGAKRLKSKFGSGLEPYSRVRATYFEKDAVELVSIQQIDLLQSSFAAAGDPYFLQKFAYLTELLIATLPPKDPNETLYRMVQACIDTASASPKTISAVALYFELWLLRLSGYMPDWNSCDECRRSLESGESASVKPNFHLVCENCTGSGSRRILDGRLRELVREARQIGPAQFAEFVGETRLEELSTLLRHLISHSIGREIAPEISLGTDAK